MFGNHATWAVPIITDSGLLIGLGLAIYRYRELPGRIFVPTTASSHIAPGAFDCNASIWWVKIRHPVCRQSSLLSTGK